MKRSSPQNSQSQKSLSQDLHQTQVLNEYLTNRFDWFATTVIDYMEEKDPQKRFGKMSEARIKETEGLRRHNKDLLQQINELKKKVRNLECELTKIKGPQSDLNQSANNITSNVYGLHLSEQNLEILPQEQRKALQQIEQMNENMKEQKQNEQKKFHELNSFFSNICERLIRINKINKIVEGDLLNEETLTVTISQQKYDLLVDFYFQGTSYLPPVQGNCEKGNVGQFRAEQISAPNQLAQKTQIFTAQELQKIFQVLAQKNGKSRQWKTYLSNRQSQNQNSLSKLREIASKQISEEDLSKLRQTKSLILNQSLSGNNTNLDTTAAGSVVDFLQKELENNLFTKIKILIKQLKFSQEQFDLFVLFDSKRQQYRLYDDDFYRKFKTKTDLFELSEAYTVYLIKTINFMLINVMELLSGSNPQNLDWFREKLSKKSQLVKEKIFKTMEEQCSEYIKGKKTDKAEQRGKKKQVKQVLDQRFDKEKRLQNELVSIVYWYRDLLKSSIFNYNNQINLTV